MPKTKDSPASGIPAKGVGKGDGWGGAPKGAGNGSKRPQITPETASAMKALATAALQDPAAMAKKRLVKADKLARIEQLTMHLADLGLNADRQETQVSATIAALNRLDGMPKQKNENFNTEVPFEEMVKASLKSPAAKE